jgi:ATP-binding cassette subfamily B (MDR/TAP) protein 1
MKFVMGNSDDNKKDLALAGHTVTEVISNIRTVAALGQEKTFLDQYADYLLEPTRKGIREGFLGGIAFGFSMLIMFSGNIYTRFTKMALNYID